jgi:hypothetical protein
MQIVVNEQPYPLCHWSPHGKPFGQGRGEAPTHGTSRLREQPMCKDRADHPS